MRAIVLGMALVVGVACQNVCLAKVPIAKIGNEKIKLEVAATPAQIQHGLMFRQSLPEDSGMVFLFRPARPVRFWMKNCFMSLDMLFIKDGKIVKIARECPPCRATKDEDCPLYPEEGEVEAGEVVEVNPGWAKRHNVKEGDAVEFELAGFAETPSPAAKESADSVPATKPNDAPAAADTAGGAKAKP